MGLNIRLWILLRCLIAKKRRLGPQNGPISLGPEKLLKIVSCKKNCFVPLGIGGFPQRSTQISGGYRTPQSRELTPNAPKLQSAYSRKSQLLNLISQSGGLSLQLCDIMILRWSLQLQVYQIKFHSLNIHGLFQHLSQSSYSLLSQWGSG